MNLRQALAEARTPLQARGIDDASLEADILLRYTLDIDRTRLYLEPERQLTDRELARFRSLVQRRISGEPSAYITGHREFYGLDFAVSPGVLIPRPETELLVEKAIEWGRRRTSPIITDVGTGSGIIAICLALNLPSAKIYATDISAAALEVTRRNCLRHGVTDEITLLRGDLLSPLPEMVDLMVANLPYVKRSDCAGLPDPLIALDGGPDGLDHVRRLCQQAGQKLGRRGAMLLEIGQDQDRAVVNLLGSLYTSASIEVYKDLAGIPRVVGLYLS